MESKHQHQHYKEDPEVDRRNADRSYLYKACSLPEHWRKGFGDTAVDYFDDRKPKNAQHQSSHNEFQLVSPMTIDGFQHEIPKRQSVRSDNSDRNDERDKKAEVKLSVERIKEIRREHRRTYIGEI